MKQITYSDNRIFAATTLKDLSRPEKQNLALHVCLDPREVMKNRQELARETGIPLERWVLPWQKHTDRFRRVVPADLGRGSTDKNTSLMDVDAIYTTEENVLIGVFTADCCGILLLDPSTPCLAAIHSGWKGTTLEITYKTVSHLIQEGLLHPETTQAYFSPSILFDSLEVGMEVIDAIRQISSVDPAPFIRIVSAKKGYIDNQGLNAAMLQACGIPKDHIHLSALDTKKEPEDCFSFRLDKQTGEHFTYGFIRSEDV